MVYREAWIIYLFTSPKMLLPPREQLIDITSLVVALAAGLPDYSLVRSLCVDMNPALIFLVVDRLLETFEPSQRLHRETYREQPVALAVGCTLGCNTSRPVRQMRWFRNHGGDATSVPSASDPQLLVFSVVVGRMNHHICSVLS